MRILSATLAVAVLAALASGSAQACSCAIVDPRAGLTEADGAFIGVLVKREEQVSSALLTFRVEEVFKGEIGSTITVRTSLSGGSCGIELSSGGRTGLLVTRQDGGWSGHLCWQVEPAKLREAARPLPRPEGTPPAALVVAGSFGGMRVVSLDARGGTIAYGRGSGQAGALSVCPGGRSMVEVAEPAAGAPEGAGAVLIVRTVPGLTVVRRQPVGFSWFASELRCLDRLGSRSLVFVAPLAPTASWSRVVLVTGRGERTRWAGRAAAAHLGTRYVHLTTGKDGDTLTRLDLATGRRARLGRVPYAMFALRPSPDGRRVAGLSPGRPREGRLQHVRVVVFDVDRARFRAAALASPESTTGAVGWIADDRLVFLPLDIPGRIRVFDPALRVIAGLGGWYANAVALDGTRAYGSDRQGNLVSATLPGGPVRALGHLPGPLTRAIAAVPLTG